jgi:hypothetical protein
MLAKISSGKSIFGVLAYNKIKVDDRHATVLYSQKMFDSPDGKFSIRDCMDSFYPYLALNQRTEKVVFHASLNPDPKDKLSDEKLSKIAQVYMQKLGYGNQPYIVLKHSDIQREHLHIISLRIDEAGKKINDSYEVVRSMKICKELEQEFNLIPLKKGEREFEYPKAINYKEGDLKHKVSNIVRATVGSFHFQSFGEYRAVLEMFNLTAEEVKGKHNGILYSVLDDKGNKTGRPFKSSLFGKEFGYEALQKHYESSKLAVEKKKIRENLRPIIAETIRKSNSKDDFKKLLKEQRLNVLFRQNQQGRIYGVTFIDYQNRAIMNGSRLGKEFSANVFNDLFNNPNKQVEQPMYNIINDIPKQAEKTYQTTNADSTLGTAFSLLDIPLQNNDYEEENFAREHKFQAKKIKKKGRRL